MSRVKVVNGFNKPDTADLEQIVHMLAPVVESLYEAEYKAQIEAISAEYSNGGISCTVRGDFTVLAIKVSPEVIKELNAGKPERFNTMLLNVVNGALKDVKKQTQELTMKMMQSGEMGSMFGG
jgi:DNA-binding protein YbaB